MKTLVRFMIIVLGCSVVLAADPNEQDRQAEIAALEARLNALHEQAQGDRQADLEVAKEAHKELEKLHKVMKDQRLAETELVLRDTREKLDKIKSSGFSVATSQPHPMPFHFGQSTQKIVVVPGADTDLQQVQEDLTVMSKILAKRLQEEGLAAWTWPDAHSIEALSIDGYGAMFIVPVDFPLLDQGSEKIVVEDEDIDTLWLETREELNASARDIVIVNTHQSKPAYDADKVERLKRTLCSSLKHASNIRSIKGQQWVVLVVNAQASGNANFFGRGLVINGQGQSSGAGSLVIKANKGDIDRFAGQQMDLEDFQGQVEMKIFARP